MSRVRVYLACSLDGCIAGPNHEIDWLEEPVPEREGCTENGALGFHDFMAQVGAMLMGRSTYDLVEGFGTWHYGDIPVLVATNRPLEPMVPTVRSVSGDIADLLAEAKREAGDRDVYLDGGDIVRQALARDLVDELCLTLIPVVLGEGIRLFEGLTERSRWRFVDHQDHHPGGFVQITLRPRGADAASRE